MAEALWHSMRRSLGRLLQVEDSEWGRFLIAFLYFFMLLGSYFMIRPLRNTVASQFSEQLHWLYTATFLSMLLLVPVFGWLVARFRRRALVPLIYGVFLLQLLAFALAFRGNTAPVPVEVTFYVWVSVFNLFVVSIFWSFMADIFRPQQAQRLFGSIMAGGSLGAMLGPLLTAGLIDAVGASGIMVLAAAGLLLAMLLAWRLGQKVQSEPQAVQDRAIGGSILAGARTVFQSPYLLLICAMMLAHNMTSTFLYNGLAVLIDQQGLDFAQRTTLYSYLDLIVQICAFTLQFLLTSRLLACLGMPRTALLPPLLLAAGVSVLGSAFGLVLFAAVQVLQRALNYGLLGPVKEMLFTVLNREQKYKSKNFIDTVVYRGSDTAASWLFRGYLGLGLSLQQAVWCYLPVMGLWALAAWRLGRRFQSLSTQSGDSEKVG
ncbi:MAG: MFS transporter [Xanthomonadales bacterium]|nr:MFS transporter [Xanthomonadales bacterium]